MNDTLSKNLEIPKFSYAIITGDMIIHVPFKVLVCTCMVLYMYFYTVLALKEINLSKYIFCTVIYSLICVVTIGLSYLASPLF
jgi:hypothetical protein